MQGRVTHIPLSSFDPIKSPDGGYLCLNCHEKIPSKRATKYCKWACQYDWLAKHSHQFLREKLIKERGHICAHCKEDKGANHTMVADHILPIALGGEEFDPANIQLLCQVCNKIKTRADMKDIGKQRKIEKLEAVGQKRLVA